MSKITRALQKASEERKEVVSPAEERARDFVKHTRGDKMRKTWFTWVIVVTAVVSVFFAFNYHGGKDAVPLSEIFPDEEVFPVEVEYEFVEDEAAEPIIEKVAEAPAEKKVETVTAAVEKAVKAEAKAVQPVASAPSGDFNYTVQIASFKSAKKAEEALAKIRAKVPSAYISSHDLGAKGVWYRIYAGQFQLRSEAEVSLNDIKQSYDSSFIITPKKSK